MVTHSQPGSGSRAIAAGDVGRTAAAGRVRLRDSSPEPGRDGDLGRAQDPVANLVALAQLADDRALGMVGGGLLEQRIVQVRVERRAQGLDRLDAVLGQDLEQLLLHHVEPGGDPFGARGPQVRRWPGRGYPADRGGPSPASRPRRPDRCRPVAWPASDSWRTRPRPAGPAPDSRRAPASTGRPRRRARGLAVRAPSPVGRVVPTGVDRSRDLRADGWDRSCSTPLRDSPRRPGSRPEGRRRLDRAGRISPRTALTIRSESSGSSSSVK